MQLAALEFGAQATAAHDGGGRAASPILVFYVMREPRPAHSPGVGVTHNGGGALAARPAGGLGDLVDPVEHGFDG